MSEDEFAGPAPGGGGNRAFPILLGAALLPVLLATVLFFTFVFPRLGKPPEQVDQAATQTAQAGTYSTAVAGQLALTSSAASAVPGKTKPSSTPISAATQTVVPTRAAPTVIAQVTAGKTVTVVAPTRAGATKTGAAPTRIGGSGSGGNGLPNGGGGDLGISLVMLAGVGLLAVVFIARKMRSA